VVRLADVVQHIHAAATQTSRDAGSSRSMKKVMPWPPNANVSGIAEKNSASASVHDRRRRIARVRTDLR